MKRIIIISLLLIQCNGCISRHKAPVEDALERDIVTHLDSSATIIQNLIASNQLSSIIEDADPQQVDSLIKNFSPAILALEVEVLSYAEPVLVIVHDHADSQLMKTIYDYAECHPERKVVYIDGEKLFKIAEDLEIDNVPAAILLHDREEKKRIEGSITPEALENLWI